MAGSIYAHVRVDEAAITDSDRGFIKNREIEVREETPSHENVAAVIVAAVHILFDRYSFNMLKNPVQLTDIIERQVDQLELLVLRGGSMQGLDEEACAHEGPVPTPPSHHTPWLRDTPRTRTGAG